MPHRIECMFIHSKLCATVKYIVGVGTVLPYRLKFFAVDRNFSYYDSNHAFAVTSTCSAEMISLKLMYCMINELTRVMYDKYNYKISTKNGKHIFNSTQHSATTTLHYHGLACCSSYGTSVLLLSVTSPQRSSSFSLPSLVAMICSLVISIRRLSCLTDSM